MTRQTVVLTTSATAMAETIQSRLEDLGIEVIQFRPATKSAQLDRQLYEIAWGDRAAAEDFVKAAVAQRETPLGGWINLLPASVPWANAPDAAAAEECVSCALAFAQLLVPHLRATELPKPRVLNVTALDGRCGFHQRPIGLAGSGTLGLFKTLQLEFPELRVTSLDFDGSSAGHHEDIVTRHWVADRVLADYFDAQPLPEVGYDRESRWRPTLLPLPETGGELGPLLREESEPVILITGGAAGVTGAVAESIAEVCRPHLVLIGRTPLAEIEAADPTDRSLAEIRHALIAEKRAQQQPIIPAEITREAQRTLRLKEMRQRLERLRSRCRSVEYHAVDLQDDTRFGDVLDGVTARYGKLTGVIHGAGVIEDRRFLEKSPASFLRVFGTKIRPAMVLRDKFATGSLKFLVFFASVSGRFGSIGQVDYAAANEHLGKLAQQLRQDWPETRVLSVAWGPWDGGMVGDDLKRLYAARGIELVPLDAGGPALLRQLSTRSLPTAETLICANLQAMLRAGNRFEHGAEATHARG
jgi:NAD(P)-dependent dehydrogenase (short-subunit alcohol dehydrogenase family)